MLLEEKKHEEELLKKKKNIKIIYESMLKDNMFQQNTSKERLKKEKEEDRKYINDYTKLLEKQELEKQNEKQKLLHKVYFNTSQQFYSKFIDLNDFRKRDIETQYEREYKNSQNK